MNKTFIKVEIEKGSPKEFVMLGLLHYNTFFLKTEYNENIVYVEYETNTSIQTIGELYYVIGIAIGKLSILCNVPEKEISCIMEIILSDVPFELIN
jgi:hypothetical protein